MVEPVAPVHIGGVYCSQEGVLDLSNAKSISHAVKIQEYPSRCFCQCTRAGNMKLKK